jgi:hypothetical protein
MYAQARPNGQSGCAAARGCLDILYSMPNPLLWYASIAATVYLVYRFVLDARLAVRGGARRNRGHVAPWMAYPERTIFQFYTIAIWPFLLLALTFALQHVAGAASTASAHGGTAGRHRLPRRSPSLLSIFWYPLWSAMQVPYEFYRLHNWMQGWVYACSAYDGGLCLPGTRDLLPAGAARQRRAGRDRARDRGASGRHRRGCDGVGQDDAAAEDLPRARPHRDRPHAAAPHRARTIAERIAHELEVPLGGAVGYKVRFTDQVSADTKIALVTDGILLNEIHRDRLLRRYDTIIVDEAHERSLNIDFLLGYLARILPERPDLKVIITSATIDPESFAKHFADAGGARPIVEVSGAPTRSRSATAARTTATGDDVDAARGAPRARPRARRRRARLPPG